jgi:hypothetical protein
METFYEIGMPKFINHLKDKFFNTINFVLKPEETFKNMCLDILQDKQINILYFNQVMSCLINSDKNPFDILYDSLNIHTENIQKQFQSDISNNTFNNDKFITEYNKYVTKCIFFKKLFVKIDKLTKSNKVNSNTIYLLSNYCFYKNILNVFYNNKTISRIS